MAQVKVGDTVGYTKRFLRSIFAGPTDEMWFMRGVVREVHPLGNLSLLTIRWKDGREYKVNAANVAKPGTDKFNRD